MQIEREKCVKASQHAKNMFFDQKNAFFYPNLRTLNMYALASFGFGFRRSLLEMTKKSLHTPKPRVGGIPPD